MTNNKLKIEFSEPYEITDKKGNEVFQRSWKISDEYLSEFFSYWKKAKFKMWDMGFSISKDDDGNWLLLDTKDEIELFKDFSSGNTSHIKKEVVIEPERNDFWVPNYTLKDNSVLRDYQVAPASKLYSLLKKYNIAIDGSELGLGKTFTNLAVIREFDLPFVIVCPKAVKSQWLEVIKLYGLEHKLIDIINYQLLVRGRSDSKVASYIVNKKTGRKKIVWNVPKNSVVVWDECHCLRHFTTKASKFFIQAWKTNKYKHLFLSATIASSPLEIRTLGIALGMFKTASEYYSFCENNGCSYNQWGMKFNNDSKYLKNIHKVFFDTRGVRLRRDDVKNFPECDIEVRAFDLDEENTTKISQIYSEMRNELKIIDNKIKKDGDNELTIRIRARQKAEMIKLPLFEELITDAIDEGMSVVVFLNFSDTIDALAKRLNTTCIFDGRISDDIREKNKKDFQNNISNVLIINILSGGAGISLPDLDGKHPRIAIISPNDSVYALAQSLGRVWRESSKSKSLQKIVYVANTAEEDVAKNVKQKLVNLTYINNGVLSDDDLKIK